MPPLRFSGRGTLCTILASLLWMALPTFSAAADLWLVSVTLTDTVDATGSDTWRQTTPIRPSELVPVSSVTTVKEGILRQQRSGRAFISAVLENEGSPGEVFFSEETEPVSITVGGSINEDSMDRTEETVNGQPVAGHEDTTHVNIPLRQARIHFEHTADNKGILAWASGVGQVRSERRMVREDAWRELEPHTEERDGTVTVGCFQGDPGFSMSRTGDGFSVSCRIVEKSTRQDWAFGTVTTTSQRTLTATIRPAGKLKAEAGGPYAVRRGGRVTLDGTGSSGAIRDYSWKLVPAGDCPDGVDPKGVERPGAVADVILLCPVTATLTVTDGSRDDRDSAAVRVEPRDWKTEFQHVPVEGTLKDSLPPIADPWLMKFNGGANTCSVDGDTTDDNHILHPPASSGTWEGAGYGLQQVNDPGGPFDGFWYADDYRVRVTRVAQVNKYTVPGGPPPLSGLVPFYDKNKAAGADIDGYLAAVRDHEKEHSRRFERWLSSNDPAREVERSAGRERDALRKTIDDLLRRAESGICKAGKDPLPTTWTGNLWFGEISGASWLLGSTAVGGADQVYLECP